MKIFHCDHCDNLVFFENIRCLNCEHALAFLPDLGCMGSLEPDGEGAFRSPHPRASGRRFRLCENYDRENVCNWAVPAGDPNPLCAACRLTRVIPDLSLPGSREAWYRLEVAKRRLVYTLASLELPLKARDEEQKTGLAFEFLSDAPGGSAPVITGHADGVITLNVAEADDAERERRRVALNEPYRTLLGHFRHESGHYYWGRLVADSGRLEAFREAFGDERVDYADALKRHYDAGPPPDWQKRFISAYAASHPWEDWAETWAHYLHFVDALETAADCGLALRPAHPENPSVRVRPPELTGAAFAPMLDDWYPVTYLLNNLNRGLGLADAYPFVLSPEIVAKLRFVHDTVVASRGLPDIAPPRLAVSPRHGPACGSPCGRSARAPPPRLC